MLDWLYIKSNLHCRPGVPVELLLLLYVDFPSAHIMQCSQLLLECECKASATKSNVFIFLWARTMRQPITICMRFLTGFHNLKLHLIPSAAGDKMPLHPSSRSLLYLLLSEFWDKYQVASTHRCQSHGSSGVQTPQKFGCGVLYGWYPTKFSQKLI